MRKLFTSACLIVSVIIGTGAGTVTLHAESETKLPLTREEVTDLLRAAREAEESVVLVRGYRDTPLRVISLTALRGKISLTETLTTGEPRVVSTGSGFFVSKDGYILTNKHVIADSQATYKVHTGKRQLTARIVYQDPIHDLAVLKVRGNNHPHLSFTQSDTTPNKPIIAIGNSFGQTVDSLSIGRVTATDSEIIVRDFQTDRHESIYLGGLIETSAKVFPGDSGGPILNESGEVVGVTVATAVGERVSFALPASLAREVIEDAEID